MGILLGFAQCSVTNASEIVILFDQTFFTIVLEVSRQPMRQLSLIWKSIFLRALFRLWRVPSRSLSSYTWYGKLRLPYCIFLDFYFGCQAKSCQNCLFCENAQFAYHKSFEQMPHQIFEGYGLCPTRILCGLGERLSCTLSRHEGNNNTGL